MKTSLCLLSMLASASLLAQQPTNEVAPAIGPSVGGPDGSIDCTVIAPPFDAQTASPTADLRILGVGNVDNPNLGIRKWFFSGSNGGLNPQTNQQIYVFDADAANYPLVAGARGVLHAPAMVSVFWGHRDLEGYNYIDTTTNSFKSVLLAGDEGDNVSWMDAVTETWVGNVNLAGAVPGILRAVAVRRDDSIPGVNTETVKVYVSDYTSGIEVWNVNLATGTAALDVSNPPLTSPTNTYGASCFNRNGLWYLAVHHQAANTCAGTGLVKITVLDINPGANYGGIVWTRTMDTTVLETTYVNGGIAGGLQYCTVNGQPCFAGLQQANADSCGFVGLSAIQGRPGPADCGPEKLVVNTDGASFLGFDVLGYNPADVYIIGLNFPPPAGIALPFNPACVLDLALPVPVTFLLIGTGSSVPIPVPPGLPLNLVADAGALGIPTGIITSTNRVDINICPPPF